MRCTGWREKKVKVNSLQMEALGERECARTAHFHRTRTKWRWQMRGGEGGGGRSSFCLLLQCHTSIEESNVDRCAT
jgi:hypothetical protein